MDSLRHRLSLASEVELNRMCIHLRIPAGSGSKEIENSYISAADNSIFKAARKYIVNDAPTYSKVLRVIYKELRPYSEALDETWHRIKSLKFTNYNSSIDTMDDLVLEKQLLQLYAAEFKDRTDMEEKQESMQGVVSTRLKKIAFWGAKWLPGTGAAIASTAATASIRTAARLPFSSAAPGVVGPVGIALSIIFVGSRLSGPAFRKIIPATVELMLIGQRIANTPEE